MFFSDMYSDSQVSEEVREDDMLWGEGFGGALQWDELMEIATEIGFSPPMLIEVSPISIEIHSCISMLFMCRLRYIYGHAYNTCVCTFLALRYVACPFTALVHICTYT